MAIQQWFHEKYWHSFHGVLPALESPSNLLFAYGLIKKKIGSSPIADVAFLGALINKEPTSYEDVLNEIMRLNEDHKAIKLSAGRYSKKPENIFIPNQLLKEIAP